MESQSGSKPPEERAHSLRELRRLLPFIRLRRWELPSMLVLGLITSCLDGLGISLVVLFLYEAIGKAGDVARSEGLIGDIFQAAITSLGGNPVLIGAVVFVIIAVASVLRYGYSILAEAIGQRISENIRVGLHDQYLDVSYDYIRRHDPSFLLDVIEDESWAISEVIAHLLSIVTNVFTIVVFAALLVATSWQFTLIAALGSLLLITCIRLLRAPAERLGATAIDVNNALTKRTLTTLNCLRTIRVFGEEAAQKRKFRAEAHRVRETFVRIRALSELVTPISEIGHMALLCVFVGAASMLGISFAGSLAAVALLHRLRPQIQSLQQRWIELAGANAALRNIRTILDRSDKVYLPAGDQTFTRLAREIRFENVTMRYPGAPRAALDSVSFTVRAGSVSAVVGPSGAGKSTIVNLLLRLYRPDSGTVLVDDVPLGNVERKSWLGKIALAGQDVELTEGTIAENIAMSRPEASPADLESAADQSGILDFIEQQPARFDAPVGERGLSLSNGQRQRVGLARALLRDPDILILDEAMSALDAALENRIRGNIEERFRSRTIVLITHRLETVLGVDHVVCIDEGKVLEEGSPRELLSRPLGALRRFLQGARPETVASKLRAHDRW
jgi:ABC-type multidrug transport system fused ATPase/permease subunit